MALADYEFSRPRPGNFEGLPPGHIALVDPKRADVCHAVASARFESTGVARAAVKAATGGMEPVQAQALQQRAEELLPLSKLS
jgi:hypothetical protein